MTSFIAGAWAAVSILAVALLASRRTPQDAGDEEVWRTKADRIRALLPHFSDVGIAHLLECDRDYVRAVRHRTGADGAAVNRGYDWSWQRRKAAKANEVAA
jgi:hypothetical protein